MTNFHVTLGRARRSPLSFLAVLRGVSSYNRRARATRTAAGLVALVLSLTSSHARWAVALVGVALAGPGLNYLMTRYGRGGLRWFAPLRLIAQATDRADGRHQLDPLAYIEIVGFCALVVSFSWVTTDLSPAPRLLGLLLAMIYTGSVGHGIFADHTWFNPVETRPPFWHEPLRLLAGPATAGIVAGIALPAPWSATERIAVVVITLLPLVISLRLWDLDATIAVLDDTVNTERRRGRELVLTETERALSESLDRLESLSSRYRKDAPELHSLAIHAKSQLREALALTDREMARPSAIDALIGPTLTLARALGVATTVKANIGTLSDSDARTASWVFQELVGNAINAGATTVDIALRTIGYDIEISVTDDARRMPLGVWKTPGTSSARLASHLSSLSGNLDAEIGERVKIVKASWSFEGHDERFDDGANDGSADTPRR